MENPINYWYQKYISLKAEMDKMMKGAVEGRVYDFRRIKEIGYSKGRRIVCIRKK